MVSPISPMGLPRCGIGFVFLPWTMVCGPQLLAAIRFSLPESGRGVREQY